MNKGRSILYIFFGLGLVSIPFPYDFFSPQRYICRFLFEDTVMLIARSLGLHPEAQVGISSDSQGMYLLLALLFGLAVIITFLLGFSKKWNKYRASVLAHIHIALLYYLSLQLFIYGCDKLFKAQFYLPEPNTLYTPLGQISKDLLFWSTMGTSYTYNVFMGLLEIIPAILLWFRNTRVLGLLMAFGVLLNIVFINLGFDISVKLYSVFLWALCWFLLLPHLKVLYDFFILKKQARLSFGLMLFRNRPSLKFLLKTLFIGFIIAEGLFPYLPKGQFNDDLVNRPFLHGAYQVEEIQFVDSLPGSVDWKIKRFYIHRRGYFIIENQKSEMRDYKLEIDSLKKKFLLLDYDKNEISADYLFNKTDSLLELRLLYKNSPVQLKAKSLDWKKMPLLRDDFHWTIEQVK